MALAVVLWAVTTPGLVETPPPDRPVPNADRARRLPTETRQHRIDHTHDHAADAHDEEHQPNRALRSDRPRPTRTADLLGGAPDDGPHPPAGDPEVWRERRAQATMAWRASAERALHEVAELYGFSDHERDEALRILVDMQDEVAEVRMLMLQGELSAADGRQRMGRARRDVMRDIEAALGPEQAGTLRRELAARVRGGAF